LVGWLQWLANRRVRTGNTLTYNGAVHPRRLSRLRRQHRDRAAPTQLPQPTHSTPTPTSAGPGPSSAPRLPSATGLFPDVAGTPFQTSPPPPPPYFRGALGRLEVDSAASARALRRRPDAAASASGSFQGVVAPFRTSTPFPAASAAHRRFGVDSAGRRGSTRAARHHPYLAADTVASVCVGDAAEMLGFRPSLVAPSANFASTRQVATAQLNVFNVFGCNSA